MPLRSGQKNLQLNWNDNRYLQLDGTDQVVTGIVRFDDIRPTVITFSDGSTQSTAVSPSSGTAGKIPLWVTSTVQGDSALTQSVVGGTVITISGSASITEKLTLVATTSPVIGVIYQGVNRFIHSYSSTGSDGGNVFIGLNSGNFTLAHTGVTTYLASNNVGVGSSTLGSLTSGYRNLGIGGEALFSLTSGYQNVAIGMGALRSNSTNVSDVAIGYSALRSCQADHNVAIGTTALYTLTSGTANAAIGSLAGYYTNGSRNMMIGYGAMYYSVSTGSDNIAIGNKAMTYADFTGYAGNSNGNVSIGSESLGHIYLTSNNNTVIGYQAGHVGTQLSGSVFIGAYAGYYETASNKLFIDNQSRTNEATSRTSSLIYGVFDSTVANQTLRFNAGVGIGVDPVAGTSFGMTYNTAISTASIACSAANSIWTPSANSSNAYYGYLANQYIAGTKNTGGIYALNYTVGFSGGSGTTTTVLGILVYMHSVNSTRTVTGDVVGIQISNALTGTAIAVSGSVYGIYLTDLSTCWSAGAGKTYGIYQAGSATNYFNGTIGVGITAPNHELEVYKSGADSAIAVSAVGASKMPFLAFRHSATGATSIKGSIGYEPSDDILIFSRGTSPVADYGGIVVGANNTIGVMCNAVSTADMKWQGDYGVVTVDGYSGNAIYVETEEDVVKGQVMAFSATSNNMVRKVPANGDMPIGIASADVTAGNKVWVITTGWAWVLCLSNVTGVGVLTVSGTAGLAEWASAVPAAPQHFREIGHNTTTADGSSTPALVLASVHFN